MNSHDAIRCRRCLRLFDHSGGEHGSHICKACATGDNSFRCYPAFDGDGRPIPATVLASLCYELRTVLLPHGTDVEAYTDFLQSEYGASIERIANGTRGSHVTFKIQADYELKTAKTTVFRLEDRKGNVDLLVVGADQQASAYAYTMQSRIQRSLSIYHRGLHPDGSRGATAVVEQAARKAAAEDSSVPLQMVVNWKVQLVL